MAAFQLNSMRWIVQVRNSTSKGCCCCCCCCCRKCPLLPTIDFYGPSISLTFSKAFQRVKQHTAILLGLSVTKDQTLSNLNKDLIGYQTKLKKKRKKMTGSSKHLDFYSKRIERWMKIDELKSSGCWIAATISVWCFSGKATGSGQVPNAQHLGWNRWICPRFSFFSIQRRAWHGKIHYDCSTINSKSFKLNCRGWQRRLEFDSVGNVEIIKETQDMETLQVAPLNKWTATLHRPTKRRRVASSGVEWRRKASVHPLTPLRRSSDHRSFSSSKCNKSPLPLPLLPVCFFWLRHHLSSNPIQSNQIISNHLNHFKSSFQRYCVTICRFPSIEFFL